MGWATNWSNKSPSQEDSNTLSDRYRYVERRKVHVKPRSNEQNSEASQTSVSLDLAHLCWTERDPADLSLTPPIPSNKNGGQRSQKTGFLASIARNTDGQQLFQLLQKVLVNPDPSRLYRRRAVTTLLGAACTASSACSGSSLLLPSSTATGEGLLAPDNDKGNEEGQASQCLL